MFQLILNTSEVNNNFAVLIRQVFIIQNHETYTEYKTNPAFIFKCLKTLTR